MSQGLDKEIVREYYERMTDQEVIEVLTQNLTGLTLEAQEIIKEEIIRCNLNPNIFKIVEAQQDTYTFSEKVYDKCLSGR
jgi:hypothetical protein